MRLLAITSLLGLLLLPVVSQCQKMEVGAGIGYFTYQGELNEDPLNTSLWGTAGQLFLRKNFNKAFSMRVSVAYGTVYGDDKYADLEATQRRRLNFRSRLFDASLVGELHFLRGKRGNNWQPYVFGGLGIFNFNPEAIYENEWYELQPFGTEGQGLAGYLGKEPYKLTQMNVPLGLGLTYRINALWSIGFEASTRLTFTDYIDDVSAYYIDPRILATLDMYTPEMVHFSYKGSSLSDPEVFEQVSQGDPSSDAVQRGDLSNSDYYLMFGFTVMKRFGKKPCNIY